VEKKASIKSSDLILAGVAIAAFVAALFAPFWVGGHSIYFSVIEEGFPVAANYPWDIFAARCLAMGRFPLWNPYASGGTVFAANLLESFFFFPRWILYMSPSVLLRDVYVIGRFWLGGIFLFIFLRRIGLKNPGALASVLCFLSAGYFTRYYNENYLTIELMLGLWLLAADGIAARRTIRSTLLCSLAVVGIIFAGHPPASFHTLIMMGLWVIYRSGRAAPRAVALFLLAGILAASAAGVQLITFAESWAFSANYHIPNLGQAHYELRHLATIAFPWIYGKMSFLDDYHRLPRELGSAGYTATTISWLPYYLGVIPLLLSGVCFLKIRRVSSAAPFFVAYLIISLGIVFGLDPFRHLVGLPLLDQIGNYKHLFAPLTLSVSITAGMGLDILLRENRRDALRAILPGVAALCVLGLYASFKSSAVGKFHLLAWGVAPMAAVCLFSMLPSRRIKLGGIIAALALTAAVYPSGYKYMHHANPSGMKALPFIRYLSAHPEGRFISLYPPLFPNLGMLWGLSDVRGSDALQPKSYWRTLIEINGGDEVGMHAYFFADGLIGPKPEELGHPKLRDLGLTYVVSPGDLGGVIMVRYLFRTADVLLPGPRYFHWLVWEIDGDRRPTLFTHSPIFLKLPEDMPQLAGDLETGVAFSPNTPPKTDGAFVSVIEKSGEQRRVLYFRHIRHNEKQWAKVPALPKTPPGAERYLLVHPGEDARHDWVGWGFRSADGDYAGFKPAIGGEITVYEAQNPPRQTILIKHDRFEILPDPDVVMRFPDEYAVDVGGRDGKLMLNFLAYRPGWRAWKGGRELKIKTDRSVTLENKTDSILLKYQPVSFAVGIWLSLASVIFGILAYLRAPRR